MKRSSKRNLILLLAVFVLVGSGCMQYVRYDALPEKKRLEPSAREFLATFEEVFELENRYELKKLLYEDFSGEKWGANQLMNRMSEVFDQYEKIDLTIDDVQVKPSQRRLVVKMDWSLSWRCERIDPAHGCKDFDQDESPDRIQRSGYTVFSLVRIDDQWLLEDEQGDLILGAFTPGYRVSP